MESLYLELILTWESVLLIVTYVRPHPHDGMQGWALVAVHCLVAWGKVRVLKQLAPVPTQPLDVLVVCLAQPPLQAPVHRPVSAIFSVKYLS